jgi:hypothetical protein
MEQGYSSTDLAWGIALHVVIGVVISISIFIQGMMEGTYALNSGFAILISIFTAIPIGLVNGNSISKPIESAKCSALSCAIGFVIMWVMLCASFMISITLLNSEQIDGNLIFMEILPYALFGIASAAMGAATAFISNSMVFHNQLPVVATQPALQVANVQSAIAPSYVSTSDTVSGGRDLYDWEVAEKKHEDRLARIPRM